MTLESFLIFSLVTLLAGLTPGPNLFLISSLSLKSGRPQALQAAYGILGANIIFASISALGLIAILNSSFLVFQIIKIFGAIYLCYLGFSLLFPKKQNRASTNAADPKHHKPFFTGLTTQLSNPKSFIFWSSLLPQFISTTTAPTGILILMMGLWATFIDFAILLFFALILNKLAKRMKPKNNWMDKIIGTLFILFGAALFFCNQTNKAKP